MLSIILFLQVAAAASPLAARPDTVRPLHDAVHYDVTLVLGDSGRNVLGEVETTWRLHSDQPIALQLDSAMRVIRVLVNGRENTRLARTLWGREGGTIIVPHEGGAGDSLTTRVRYRGEVRQGLVFRGSKADGLTIFADNWPDRVHGWLPVQDHPSDKASVSFHVQVPTGFEVIANGVLRKVDTLPYGHEVWHYDMPRPIPVYTMVVGVGNFAVTRLPDAACDVRCVPSSVWTYPPDSAWAVQGPFRRLGDVLAYLSALVGPFPYPALAHVESSTEFGGMENSGAIFYNDSLYRARRLTESVVVHETAHQWFGDAVTEADWHHLWLSEGFASYAEALWAEHAGGVEAGRAVMRADAAALKGSPAIERPILDTAQRDLMGLLNTNNYQKGAWVLHQLRGLIGDSAFVAGLRAYYRTYRDSTALSSDFARVMSEASGQSLDWYFTQALTQPGYPVLDIRWALKGGRLALTVRQTQKPEWGTYRLPGLELVIDGKRVKVDVAGRETRTVIRGVSAAPRSIAVDPEGHWLLDTKVAGDR
jgi:aminopeptidase N